MKICLIGKNLSNVVLASVLANKKLAVDIIYDSVEKKKFPSRTLGISKSNFIFLNNINKKYKISAWPVDKIKIFCEDNEPKELFEFNSQGQENFFLVKYDNLYKYFFNSLKSYKNIKFIKFKKKI